MSDVKSSTATATTATAEPPYTGRFAPSPTGPLHLGSLVAAVGSYLDARSHGGARWLLRIEDLDTARVSPGAERAILEALTAFGLRHDATIEHQSERLAHYDAALARLASAGLLFHCGCTRREISAAGLGDEPRCIADCRQRVLPAEGTAVRLRLESLPATEVLDRSGQRIRFDPAVHTDVVVRRRDGVIAYHLAVVVDDAAQGVTDVVRGGDLLSATGWQIAIQRALQATTPRYLHLPVVVEPGGQKLAKSRRSVPLDAASAPALLWRALQLLGQSPPPSIQARGLTTIWDWALAHWDPAAASLQPEVVA